MDHIDLSMGIPLLIENQNETIVYMDNPDIETDSGSIIFKNEDETLIVNEDSEALLVKNGDETIILNKDNEALLVNNQTADEVAFSENEDLIVNPKDDDDEETIVVRHDSEAVVMNDFLSTSDMSNISNELIESKLLDKNNEKEDNTLLIQNFGGSPLYLNGHMVQLMDGTTAFIENPKNSENEIYTPIKLYNGSVIYVVAGTLLNTINNSDSSNNCDTNENEEGTVTNVPEAKTEKNKGFQCTYKNCNKSYSSFHHLKVHLRVHTGDRPFRCSVAGCSKAFSTGFGLKTHFRTHNGERPYMCNHENCEKGFKTSGDLQKHIRTHTGERPFVCPIPNCGRSFTTCNICKVHVRTHTGERPYKCTYPNCGKTFASVTNQRNHMRIHSGEKPYVCSVEKCGRRFTEYSSLYKHNMVHRQQPHLCLICGKTYRQASGLLMHTKSAHGEQEETFLMVDKSLPEEISQQVEEPAAIFFVDNIKLEDDVLEDQLFSEL